MLEVGEPHIHRRSGIIIEQLQHLTASLATAAISFVISGQASRISAYMGPVSNEQTV